MELIPPLRAIMPIPAKVTNVLATTLNEGAFLTSRASNRGTMTIAEFSIKAHV